jgi:glycosyltransferase involved in cell wall biosynthesis
VILLDALHINNGGGLSLLRLLIKNLEESSVDVFYLLDKRVEEHFSFIPKERRCILKPGVLSRLHFYEKKANEFECFFCFANFPPFRRYKAKTITYFQNVLLLKEGNFKFTVPGLLGYAKKLLLYLNRNNTDIWIVQTTTTREKLSKSFKDQFNKIEVFPFWDADYCNIKKGAFSEPGFLYVSDGHPHKNHLILLQAWDRLFDLGYRLRLTLTVNFAYSSICERIKYLQEKGLDVNNTGLVSKEDIKELYASSNVTVYPSLDESFGLGIIEAVSAGHEVIASDLEYVKAIVDATRYFDPHNPEDIVKAVLFVLKGENVPNTKLLVTNHLTKLINILKTPTDV